MDAFLPRWSRRADDVDSPQAGARRHGSGIVGSELRDSRRGDSDADGRAWTRWVTPTAFLLLAWTLPAALNVTMDLLFGEGIGANRAIGTRIVANALPWYVWAPFTPAVRRLVRARPLLRPVSATSVAAHLTLCAIVTLVFVVTLRVARHALGFPPSHAGLAASAFGWAPFTLLAYAAVAGIAHAALYARRARDEAVGRAVLAEQLARAQLDALRMQLHPHFLFNALNTISMLVRDRDVESAVQLIAELGGILRELLRDGDASIVPFRSEIDLVGRYLAIEQVRFGDRLTIEWYVEPEVLDAAVPPLILQPIVENAIRHGIARGTGAGRLRIEAAARGTSVVLSVSDDGPEGPRPVATAPESAPRRGLGLTNTRARLARLYGDTAYVRLTRTEARLTLATIVLPLTRVVPESPTPRLPAPAAFSTPDVALIRPQAASVTGRSA